MTILQTKFYSIPVVIENITASAHITYFSHHPIFPYASHATLTNFSDVETLVIRVKSHAGIQSMLF